MDQRIDDFRRLNEPRFRRRYETERAIFVAEGPTVVARVAAVAPHLVRTVLVDAARSDRVPDAIDPQRVLVMEADAIAAAVGFDFHRGVLAVCDRPAGTAEITGFGSMAVLEGIGDHENLGAIIRAAAGLGIEAVLLDPTCADPWYRRTVRVSMGTVLDVPIVRSTDWPGDLDRLAEDGMSIIAASPAGGADVAEIRTVRPAIVLGSEGPGLSDEVLGRADVVARIPMWRGVDSLNVGQAAAVFFDRLLRSDGGR